MYGSEQPRAHERVVFFEKTAMKAYKVSWKVAGTAPYILFKLLLFIFIGYHPSLGWVFHIICHITITS